ncbi:class I SAM-dependent methyltransferase [Microbacterium dextranolyticum]|uniref:class I SAM-dependent methyltransferase n=1 Tax=Microbacterium dextranolyticum TaxID=36806 RepID=UPI00195995BE|nr:class I SAM-dependent methyltransferase [Microbacterium dextranolyticum]MBM7462170.1 SAM-dependent methyltransferase [Microbacterium dextranolyticum]
MDAADFARAAHVIQTFGEPMKFYKWTRIYLPTPMGWKHWTMDRNLDETTLVNRGRVEHVYGIQNMPITRSCVASEYDVVASEWDKKHCLTDDEIEGTTTFIKNVFGEQLWRTLDVGCGTGWPMTTGLVDPVRYVGIDHSTAMLNALVAKHAVTAGIHAMTWSDAHEKRVLCGTHFDSVLALGGTASYLSPAELREVTARGKRGAVVMHYRDGEGPVTDDLDAAFAAASLRAATRFASSQVAVGRFVVSHLPEA